MTPKPETVRRSAPVLVAVLVLALVAIVYVGVQVAGPTGSSSGAGSDGSDVPVLALTTYYPVDPHAAPDPRYGLSSPLSTDAPPPMDVRTVRPYGDLTSRATALATAAGLTGSSTREGTSRVWSGDTLRLGVEPSGRWTLASTMAYAAPGIVTGSGTVADDGPVGSSPGAPTVAGGAAADVTGSRSAAQSLLDALGVSADAAHETVQGGVVTLSVTPDLGGLPSVGLETTVSAVGGSVSYAQGWLAATEPGPAYPVVSASVAFDILTRTSLPMPMMACPAQQSPPPDAVACGGPITVTGARLGLSVQETSEGPLLVPSWLFDVRGSEAPLVGIAVPPRLLAPAAAVEPGSPGAGQPSSTDQPGDGPSDMPVDPPQSRFTSVTRGANDRTIDVTFYGGVPDCYSYRVAAEERDDATVELTLVTVSGSAKICIDLAVQITRTVTLSAPLGVRRVVDPTSGETLLGPTR